MSNPRGGNMVQPSGVVRDLNRRAPDRTPEGPLPSIFCWSAASQEQTFYCITPAKMTHKSINRGACPRSAEAFGGCTSPGRCCEDRTQGGEVHLKTFSAHNESCGLNLHLILKKDNSKTTKTQLLINVMVNSFSVQKHQC